MQGLGWIAWFDGLHNAIFQTKCLKHGEDTYTRLRRAQLYIERNCTEPIDLEAIARQAYFSRYHFLRVFRRTFDMTPHQYLTVKRIEKAKELLENTDLSVTEVCLEIGFQSLGSFSTLFHRYEGKSPHHYRTKIFQCPLTIVRPEMVIPGCFLTGFGVGEQMKQGDSVTL